MFSFRFRLHQDITIKVLLGMTTILCFFFFFNLFYPAVVGWLTYLPSLLIDLQGQYLKGREKKMGGAVGKPIKTVLIYLLSRKKKQ